MGRRGIAELAREYVEARRKVIALHRQRNRSHCEEVEPADHIGLRCWQSGREKSEWCGPCLEHDRLHAELADARRATRRAWARLCRSTTTEVEHG